MSNFYEQKPQSHNNNKKQFLLKQSIFTKREKCDKEARSWDSAAPHRFAQQRCGIIVADSFPCFFAQHARVFEKINRIRKQREKRDERSEDERLVRRSFSSARLLYRVDKTRGDTSLRRRIMARPAVSSFEEGAPYIIYALFFAVCPPIVS